MVLRYGNALEQARADHPGPDRPLRGADARTRAVRRERLCAFLGVPWEAGDARLRRASTTAACKAGLGDWKAKIKSGEIQPAEPPPPLEEIHPSLRELCVAWGYESAPAAQPAS